MNQKAKGIQASVTVEMSLLVPLILFLVMACILVIFYYHDKNILAAAAYETAVTGSTRAREKGGADAGELEAMFAERIRGKCILFAGADVRVAISDEEITVEVAASRRGMRLSLEQRAAVTEPEKEIRKWRRFL